VAETPRRLGFQPRLDGLRGVAIALVVLYHVGLGSGIAFFDGGFLGVHLFFALSGFLITALLLEEWERHERISLQGFYMRRALRLGPPLALFLSFWLAVALVAYHGYARDAMLRFVFFSALYSANIALAHGVHLSYALTWTLSQEEQFYLLWPLGLVLLLRRGWTHRRLFALAVVLALASATYRAILWHGETSWQRIYFDPLTESDALLLGCGAGILFTYASFPRIVARWRDVAAVAAIVVVVVCAWAVHVSRPALSTGSYLAFAVASVVLVGAAVARSPVLGWLELHPLRYLGKISYTVYLWNAVIIAPGHLEGTWAKRIAGALLSIGIGAVSYRFFERGFLLRKARYAPRERKAADIAVVVS
jgi:peptidoglycan/LPS O-acetylase OafA/YrhL